MYRLQRSLKSQRLSPEEYDVRLALSDYTDRETTESDFVPTRVLYGIYRRWKGGGKMLTPVQFGVALRRCYANVKRVRRTCSKKSEPGFCFLKGPKSQVTRYGSHKTAATAATFSWFEAIDAELGKS